MIIYRPHRGGFEEAMELSREFETAEDMKEYIVKEHTDADYGPAFSIDDIVLKAETTCDPRNGWKDSRYVCVKRYFNQDYMKMYGCPQCIGTCATDY